jgi:hypothetical protein
MAKNQRARDESWTVPFHVVMWTVIVAGVVMTMAIVMMH